jgi:hypothetical protein
MPLHEKAFFVFNKRLSNNLIQVSVNLLLFYPPNAEPIARIAIVKITIVEPATIPIFPNVVAVFNIRTVLCHFLPE